MEPTTLLLLCAAALVVATVVVASGFGLGTALTPLFLLSYDIKTAVFLVAIVHFANNLFRLGLFWKQIDSAVVRRFGLLSVAGAVAGSVLLERTAGPGLEIGLGALLMALGGAELLPGERGWRIPRRYDQFGGLLSRLPGGLRGNQGALR
ncbi:MAG: sulfite exporter TauE/SafE family protein, partial [Nevskiales bacterium]